MKIIDTIINTIKTKDPNHINSFIPLKDITYDDIINEWENDRETEINKSFKKLKEIV
jgi:hypothetical protein